MKNIFFAQEKYIADGEINEFEFSFKILMPSQIIVLVNNEPCANYALEIFENGGRVSIYQTLNPADEIILMRNTEVLRLADFQDGGIIKAKNINDEFDNFLHILEEFKNRLECSPYFDFSQMKNLKTKLPNPAAGHFLMWNKDGTAIVNSDAVVAQNLSDMADFLNQNKEYLDKACAIATSDNTKGVLGLLNNLAQILSETHPDFVIDFGSLSDEVVSSQDLGNLSSASEELDNGLI